MPEITLLPTGKYMDGPERGKTFAANESNQRFVKVRYSIGAHHYEEVIYELKWWQYQSGEREARYYLTEESAATYRMWPPRHGDWQ